jgi:hypothetical protein
MMGTLSGNVDYSEGRDLPDLTPRLSSSAADVQCTSKQMLTQYSTRVRCEAKQQLYVQITNVMS